jgi:hypothetical protein
MARVPVLKPLSGKLVYVEESDLAAAKDEGYGVPTAQEVAQAELGEKYGGIEAKVGAVVGGALRGATLSGSDLLASQLGLGERLRAYQELEPGLSIGSEVVGAVAPIIASAIATAPAGGAGAAPIIGSLAARIAAQAPAALAMRAGERAVAGLGLAAAEGATQGIGRTALRFGVQGAAEGALQGAGREAGQLALDNQLNGERIGQIAAAGLTGGALGFGLGGGIGAGAGLLGKVARRGAPAAAQEAAGRVEAPLADLATPLEAGAVKAPVGAVGDVLEAVPVGAVAPLEAAPLGAVAPFDDATLRGDPLLRRRLAHAQNFGEVSAAEPLGDVLEAVPAAGEVAPLGASAATTLDDVTAATFVDSLTPPPGVSRPVAKTLLKVKGRMAGLKGAELDDAMRLAEPKTRAAALDGKKRLAELVSGKQPEGGLLVKAQPESIQADLDRKWVLEQKTATLIRNGDLKIASYKGLVSSDADSLLGQRAFATEALQQSIDDIDRAILEGKQQYAQTGLPQLRHELLLAQREVGAALELGGAEGAEAAYKALDVGAKRAVGRTTSNFQGLPNMGAQHRRLLTDILEPVYGRLRTGLEDEAIWGAAGAQNRRMNAPMAASFDKSGMVMQSWYHGTSYGAHPTNPWLSGRVANPESILSNITATTKPTENIAYKALIEQIADQTQWQKAALEFGNLSELPVHRAEMTELAALNVRLQKKLIEGAQIAKAQKTLADLGAGVGFLPKWISPLLGTRTVLRAAEMLDNIAEGKAGTVAAGVTKAADAIGKTSVVAVKRAPTTGVAAAAFAAKAASVRKLAEQLPAIEAQVAKQTEWLAEQAPTARTEAVKTAVRQVDYLNANLPKGLKAPTPYAQDLPPTRAQIQTWLVRLRTVENPASLLDDVASGKLSPEAVDAVRTVYPATFADMQARVVQKLAKLQAEGRAPNVATRTQLGLLLGIPTDPLLMPQSMRAIQGIYPPPASAGPSGALLPVRRGPPPNIAKNYQSGSEGIALTSELK